MKDFQMLVWLTQLGISVALPLAGFVFGAVWLRSRFGLGTWIIWAGVIVGGICAVSSFRQTLAMMDKMARGSKPEPEPPVSFNDHN